MTTQQSEWMRAHWRAPGVRARRRAGVRARRARRNLDERIARLERRLDGWSDTDPAQVLDPADPARITVGDLLAETQRHLHELRGDD